MSVDSSSAMTAIQEYDFIGKRRLDGTYDVWQAVRSGNVHFEGPLSRADAERHLLTLAKELDEDAWIEELDNTFRPIVP